MGTINITQSLLPSVKPGKKIIVKLDSFPKVKATHTLKSRQFDLAQNSVCIQKDEFEIAVKNKTKQRAQIAIVENKDVYFTNNHTIKEEWKILHCSETIKDVEENPNIFTIEIELEPNAERIITYAVQISYHPSDETKQFGFNLYSTISQKQQGGFSFGGQPSTSSVTFGGQASTSSVTFGGQTSASSGAFGAPSSSTSSSPGGTFSFTSPGSSVSFGAMNSTGNSGGFHSTGFSFGNTTTTGGTTSSGFSFGNTTTSGFGSTGGFGTGTTTSGFGTGTTSATSGFGPFGTTTGGSTSATSGFGPFGTTTGESSFFTGFGSTSPSITASTTGSHDKN